MRSRAAISILCIAAGSFVLLIGLDVIEVDPSDKHAPNSIIVLCGLVFVIAGFMALLGQRSRVNDLLAAVLCLVFGVIGAWVALFSSNEGFSGGLPFVSRETNVAVSRFVFGIGSLMCFATAAWAMKRFRRTEE